jgi:pimeloyl-ACP methyl ester carboxylesterase
MAECRHEQLYLIGIREQPIRPGLRRIRFQTSRGQFEAVAHTGAEADRGVVMLSGFRGDFEGPGLVYPELASRLADEGLMALRLSYRIPGDCVQCGLDTLLALQYLYDEGIEDVVVVGWSFGAAVAVAVGSVAKTVRGVAAVSYVHTPGCCTSYLRTKPILVVHGANDRISPCESSRRLYAKAGPHRRLIIYPDVGHDLTPSRNRLLVDLEAWTIGILHAASLDREGIVPQKIQAGAP